MARNGKSELLAIAHAVGDQTPIDWEQERSDHPELCGALGGLRQLEEMASAFRSFQTPRAGQEAEPSLFVWGHLEVREKLGEGSFGEVFRAFDPLLRRWVALKLRRIGPSHEEGSGRHFIEEGRRLARIRHDNVVTVYGADQHCGRVGLWTELIDGSTLAEQLTAGGPLGPQEAISVGLDLCRALAAVHAAGLVHGDIKAANVLRERGGRIILTDFGSGTEQGSPAAAFGSPAWIAPEVLFGAPSSPASDLYSLGVLLFFVLSGEHPIEAGNVQQLLEAHRQQRLRSLRDLRPELPDQLIALVERALQTDPQDRYATSGEMERALRQILTRPELWSPRAAKGSRGRQARWALGAASLLAVATAVVFVSQVQDQAPGQGGGAPRADGSETTIQVPRPDVSALESALRLEAKFLGGAAGRQQPLGAGATVAPGDLLHIEIDSPEEISVYVLNEDRRGEFFVLFPVADLDLENPLPAGHHRLPGSMDGVTQDWQVTSAGGVETFLVIAARMRLEDLERHFTDLVSASAGWSPPTGGDTLRGVGGLTPAWTETSGSRLAAIGAEMRSRQDRDGSVWVQRYELLNPLR